MVLEGFERLEDGLGRLLVRHDALQAELKDLRSALESRDREIEELKEKVKRLDKEKTAVKERVDGLLEKLDSLIQGV